MTVRSSTVITFRLVPGLTTKWGMPGTSLRTPDLATARSHCDRAFVSDRCYRRPFLLYYYSTEVQQHSIRPYHSTVLKVWEDVTKCNSYPHGFQRLGDFGNACRLSDLARPGSIPRSR
jgi:hypothetical protein